MNSENSSPLSSKRRRLEVGLLMNLEVLHWSDNTTTLNWFHGGVPSKSYGPIEGRLSMPEALAWLSINLRD